MFVFLLKKFFGSKNECDVKCMVKVVQVINVFEFQMVVFFDEQLKVKMVEFQQCYVKGEMFD